MTHWWFVMINRTGYEIYSDIHWRMRPAWNKKKMYCLWNISEGASSSDTDVDRYVIIRKFQDSVFNLGWVPKSPYRRSRWTVKISLFCVWIGLRYVLDKYSNFFPPLSSIIIDVMISFGNWGVTSSNLGCHAGCPDMCILVFPSHFRKISGLGQDVLSSRPFTFIY